MRIFYIVILPAISIIFFNAADIYADTKIPFAISAKAGTLGAGGEVIAGILPNLNAKVGGNGFKYEYDNTESDIKYGIDLELLSFSALLDWFPFKNGFRLTGGMLVNENELNISAESASTYEIGNVTYNAAQVGSLTGNISFNSVAPYLGLGWGNPFGKEGHWSLSLDAGVLFQGSPKVDLNADGSLQNNGGFLAELAREEESLEDELDAFEFYPVISIGFTYKF